MDYSIVIDRAYKPGLFYWINVCLERQSSKWSTWEMAGSAIKTNVLFWFCLNISLICPGLEHNIGGALKDI
jgi:hypothetical protein